MLSRGFLNAKHQKLLSFFLKDQSCSEVLKKKKIKHIQTLFYKQIYLCLKLSQHSSKRLLMIAILRLIVYSKIETNKNKFFVTYSTRFAFSMKNLIRKLASELASYVQGTTMYSPGFKANLLIT